ncbi:MAG TPA: hypothetical protein VF911_07015 [Thermoanaerobaculia bacterium]|jgi:hypothetical protein
MRRFAVCSLLFLLAGCASSRSERPAGVAQPDIGTEAVGSVFFGSGSSAPITLEVAVRNNAQTAIAIREVEISAPGMTTYTIRPVRRPFNEVIAAGDTRSVTLFTTAYTTVRDPSEPLTLRTIVTFEANGQRWREFVQR